MDITVHRYRFSDFIPAALCSIAVDNCRNSDSNSSSGLVALGRQDGSIELTAGSQDKWHTIATIAGQDDFMLRALAFSECPSSAGRLFGASLRGFLFEVSNYTSYSS